MVSSNNNHPLPKKKTQPQNKNKYPHKNHNFVFAIQETAVTTLAFKPDNLNTWIYTYSY